MYVYQLSVVHRELYLQIEQDLLHVVNMHFKYLIIKILTVHNAKTVNLN